MEHTHYSIRWERRKRTKAHKQQAQSGSQAARQKAGNLRTKQKTTVLVGRLSSLLIHRSTAVLLYVSLRTFCWFHWCAFIALTVMVWCYAQDASECLFQSHSWVGRACCQSTTAAWIADRSGTVPCVTDLSENSCLIILIFSDHYANAVLLERCKLLRRDGGLGGGFFLYKCLCVYEAFPVIVSTWFSGSTFLPATFPFRILRLAFGWTLKSVSKIKFGFCLPLPVE